MSFPQDPTSVIQLHTVEVRQDEQGTGQVVQITYGEPAEQSPRVSRLRMIAFDDRLVPKHLLHWMQETQDLIYAVIEAQQEREDRPVRQ